MEMVNDAPLDVLIRKSLVDRNEVFELEFDAVPPEERERIGQKILIAAGRVGVRQEHSCCGSVPADIGRRTADGPTRTGVELPRVAVEEGVVAGARELVFEPLRRLIVRHVYEP